MLREPDGSNQIMMAPARIAALDRARTFITLSVLLHHSVLILYLVRSGRSDALARLRSGGAVQRQLLHGLHVFHLRFVVRRMALCRKP
jgi:hypothetical protein